MSVIIHATNCIIWFLTSRWSSYEVFFKRFCCWGRVLDFSLTNEITLGTQCLTLWPCLTKLVLSVSKKELPLSPFFLPPWVLMQMGERHRDVCGTTFVIMHPEPNVLDRVSTNNKMRAGSTTDTQIDSSLFVLPSGKFIWIILDVTSTQWNHFNSLIPSLPDD